MTGNPELIRHPSD